MNWPQLSMIPSINVSFSEQVALSPGWYTFTRLSSGATPTVTETIVQTNPPNPPTVEPGHGAPSARRVAVWILVVQCLLALSWSVYVLFLPTLLDQRQGAFGGLAAQEVVQQPQQVGLEARDVVHEWSGSPRGAPLAPPPPL